MFADASLDGDAKYKRDRKVLWTENNCTEGNTTAVGKENYYVSGDGHLMPARKDQAPPDLRISSKRSEPNGPTKKMMRRQLPDLHERRPREDSHA